MTIPIASHILYIMICEIMLQLDIEDKYITDSWFNYRKKLKLYSYSDINLKIIITIKIDNKTSENKSNQHLEKQQNPFISLTRKRTTIYIFHLYMFSTEPNDTYALCETHQTSITSIYLWGNMITYIYDIYIYQSCYWIIIFVISNMI